MSPRVHVTVRPQGSRTRSIACVQLAIALNDTRHRVRLCMDTRFARQVQECPTATGCSICRSLDVLCATKIGTPILLNDGSVSTVGGVRKQRTPRGIRAQRAPLRPLHE